MPAGVFILAGWLFEHAADAVEAHNTFIKDQQQEPGEFRFTLVLFDHEYDVAYKDLPIGDVKPMTLEDFSPRGGTPLLDTIGRAMSTHQDDTMFVIYAGGNATASTEYNVNQVREMITARKSKGSEFVVLSQDLGAIELARKIGTQPKFFSNYSTLFSAGTTRAMMATAHYRGAYATDDADTQEGT